MKGVMHHDFSDWPHVCLPVSPFMARKSAMGG
nr:MAG TPA: hypothetical protein [Caudoviricetes sp.]